MSPPCRRAVGLTSGDHPERDPDLPAALTPAGAAVGPLALRSRDVRPWPPGPAGPVSGAGEGVGGMPAPRGGPLVGGAGELGSLERILGGLDRGGPAAIAVAGGPGIGKTRLLAELAARAGARGYLVLSGAASEFENDLPFSVFVDALDEYVAGLDPDRLAVLDDAIQAELAHVFPSLSALAAGREAGPQAGRYRSHR